MSNDNKFPHEPFSDHLVVRMEEVAQTTESGLHLPDTAKQVSNKGVIVAMGPDCDGIAEIGDRVMVQAARVEFLKYNDAEFAIIRKHQLIIKLKD